MPNPSGEYVLKIIAAKTESGAESGQHTSGGLMSATSMAKTQYTAAIFIGRSSKWLGNMTDIHAIWDRAPASQL